MTDLIRNCVHHSHHSTYIERDGTGAPSAVRKVSFTQAGAADLKREVAGLHWYCDRLGIPSGSVLIESDIRDQYAKIRMTYHAGETVRVPIDPAMLSARLDALLTHHFDVFGPGNYQHTHGDYSICNHVFSGTNVSWVIDWEHFNDTLPPAYDAVYAVLEPYLFWIANDHQPSSSSIAAANKMLERIRAEIGEDAVPDNPATWLRGEVEANKDVWGAQWAKVPFVAFDLKHVDALDKALIAK